VNTHSCENSKRHATKQYKIITFSNCDELCEHCKIFIKKIQQDATMYQNFIIPYFYEARHVSGDTPPIIRSLILHWQPLVVHTQKVLGRVVGGFVRHTNLVEFFFMNYTMMHGSMNIKSIIAGQLLKAVISITSSLGPFLSSHHCDVG
jgi:hypothetical protein